MEEKNVHIEGFEPDESLLLRYIWEKVSVEERVWVDNWLQDDEEHENVLLQLANIYYAIHTQQRIEARDPLDAYVKVQKRISLPRRKIWLYHGYIGTVYSYCSLDREGCKHRYTNGNGASKCGNAYVF